MRYKTRRAWRHFKYKLLELCFGKPQLKKLLDIDRLDFEDAVKLTQINTEMWLAKDKLEWFKKNEKRRYGLQYTLARQMAETLAKHIEVSEVYDLDREKYLCVGSLVLADRKEE